MNQEIGGTLASPHHPLPLVFLIKQIVTGPGIWVQEYLAIGCVSASRNRLSTQNSILSNSARPVAAIALLSVNYSSLQSTFRLGSTIAITSMNALHLG